MARRSRSAVVEETSHGLQTLAQKIRAAPQGRLACKNIVGPVCDAPQEVGRASFREESVACVQEIGSHGWVSSDLGVRIDKNNIFSFAFPHGDIDITDLSPLLLVQARAWYTYDGL